MITSFLVVILTVMAIVVTMDKFVKRSKYIKALNKIPSLPGYPLIGQLPFLIGSLEKSWEHYRNAAKEFYPIYKYHNGHFFSVVLLEPGDIEILLTSKKNMRKPIIYRWLEAWFGTGLLTSVGDKWHRRRKMLTPTFHFNILQHFVEVFVEHSELLTNRLAEECDKAYTDVVPVITHFALGVICETAMGTKLDDTKEEIKEYINAVHRMGEIFFLRIKRPWLFFDWIYNLTSTKKEEDRLIQILHNFSTSVIKERQRNFNCLHAISEENVEFRPKRKLAMLDLLISAQKQGLDISDEGIREEVDTFMFGGHDTTTTSICFTLILLANHPAIQQKLVDELKEVLEPSRNRITFQDLPKLRYLEQVLKESLRLYPSAPIIARLAEEDIRTSTGYTIPANTFTQVHIFDLHRNPRFYPDPHKFDPDRFPPDNCRGRHPFAYIPFSAGPRNCIGQKFAVMELKTVIASILLKFILKPIDAPSDLKLLGHLVIKSSDGIKIKLELR